jgi:hypothetical protein
MNGWRGAPRRSLFCGLLIAAAGIVGLLIVYSPSTEGNGFEAFFDG